MTSKPNNITIRRSQIARSAQSVQIPFATVCRIVAVAAVCALAIIVSHWSIFRQLIVELNNDPNYSVCLLVPFLAIWCVWHDRAKLQAVEVSPSWIAGLALLAVAQLVRFGGMIYMYESIERYAMILTVAGMVLLVAGRKVFWKLRWVLVFLFLMVPLPGRVHNMISGPLQNLATRAAVSSLVLVGVPVLREGNTMIVGNLEPMAVAEACSGLRMLTAFVIVAATLAYFANRPRWQKVVMIISSVPVAIFCNQIRLFLTALLFIHVDAKLAEKVFHDVAGWFMMPLAVVILLGELYLLNKLVVPDQPQDKSRTGAAGQPEKSKINKQTASTH